MIERWRGGEKDLISSSFDFHVKREQWLSQIWESETQSMSSSYNSLSFLSGSVALGLCISKKLKSGARTRCQNFKQHLNQANCLYKNIQVLKQNDFTTVGNSMYFQGFFSSPSAYVNIQILETLNCLESRNARTIQAPSSKTSLKLSFSEFLCSINASNSLASAKVLL